MLTKLTLHAAGGEKCRLLLNLYTLFFFSPPLFFNAFRDDVEIAFKSRKGWILREEFNIREAIDSRFLLM